MQYRIIQVFCGFSHALAMFCKWCPLFLFPLMVIDSPENLGLAFVLWNWSSGFSSQCLFQVAGFKTLKERVSCYTYYLSESLILIKN